MAVSVLFDLARELNKAKADNQEKAVALAATLKYLGGLLGILQDDPEAFLKGGFESTLTALDSSFADEVEQQIQLRLEAKKNKDWASADRIRDELKAKGVILEDVAGGTTWRLE